MNKLFFIKLYDKFIASFSLKAILMFIFKSVLPLFLFFAGIFLIYLLISKDGSRSTEKHISVQIEGAVKSPGVKDMNDSEIVKDLIDKAGGFADGYDKDYVSQKINMAKKLKDGDSIFVPYKKTLNPESYTPQGKININKATADELDSLPGVGQVTANKIIQNRPYQSIDELLSKKILSKSAYDKITSQISI